MIWQELKGWLRVLRYKGQLNSELIYEVIVSPKMPTKIFPDFCPGCHLENVWLAFWRNDDLINSFILNLTDL
jgi:hypothetical protein